MQSMEHVANISKTCLFICLYTIFINILFYNANILDYNILLFDNGENMCGNLNTFFKR